MKRYTLKHPITPAEGAPITEVLIRRGKGKDLRIIDGLLDQPMALTLRRIDQLCQFPDGSSVFPGFADELDEEDVEALGELVMPKSVDGPKTGATD